MQPNNQAPSTMTIQDYSNDADYRNVRWRVRWASIFSYLNAIANFAIGYVILRNVIHYQLDDTFELFAGIMGIVFGIVLLIVGILITRRVRWAAGVGIALGIINILIVIYYVFQGGPFQPAIGSVIYTWLCSNAYNAIPAILTYEKPQNKLERSGSTG